MNKKELVTKVSEKSGVNQDDCIRVLDAFEEVFSRELSASRGIGNAFDKVYHALGFIKNKKGNK